MNESIGKWVTIGQKVQKYNGEALGYGLYVNDGSVHASVMGQVCKSKDLLFTINNKMPVKCIAPCLADVVYGQVTKIREEEAFISIFQVNGETMAQRMEGVIRKENVREKMIDKVVMLESFRPFDIVKGKVISMGDSVRNLYVSTAAEDLGVLVARRGHTKELMLPFDWNTMIQVNSGVQEQRKVAKPE